MKDEGALPTHAWVGVATRLPPKYDTGGLRGFCEVTRSFYKHEFKLETVLLRPAPFMKEPSSNESSSDDEN